jgi:hypothetical protein
MHTERMSMEERHYCCYIIFLHIFFHIWHTCYSYLLYVNRRACYIPHMLSAIVVMLPPPLIAAFHILYMKAISHYLLATIIVILLLSAIYVNKASICYYMLTPLTLILLRFIFTLSFYYHIHYYLCIYIIYNCLLHIIIILFHYFSH